MEEIVIGSKPKLGFIGVGWIGRNRLEAIAKENIADIKGIHDPHQQIAEQSLEFAPGAILLSAIGEMLSAEVDGIVIATPSALHASQSIDAIEHGKSVFCQKPLGRNATEVRNVVSAAKTHNVLLRVDFSYRFTNGMIALKKVLDSGELGDIYGGSLVFHNAYGPDKSWYFNPALAGGGCLIDLGIHLIDLLVWLFRDPDVQEVNSHLFSKGRLITDIRDEVEDYAAAQFLVNSSIAVQLACSWNLAAGMDALIEVSFYGTNGGVSFKNINGSFYDFVCERYYGTSRQLISEVEDAWGGKAAIAWAEELAKHGNQFNPDAEEYIQAAEILDKIYQRR
jgi:predicted dehydrogenase